MADSPTTRTLRLLRKRGYVADVVERWLPRARKRKDLFGIADILALRGAEILAVQTTSGSNVSARVKKIEDAETVSAVREAGIKIHVHGWRKNSKGKWVVREVDVS